MPRPDSAVACAAEMSPKLRQAQLLSVLLQAAGALDRDAELGQAAVGLLDGARGRDAAHLAQVGVRKAARHQAPHAAAALAIRLNREVEALRGDTPAQAWGSSCCLGERSHGTCSHVCMRRQVHTKCEEVVACRRALVWSVP